MSEEEGAKNVKIVLLGSPGVGKTSIINRYCRNTFMDHIESTAGASFASKILKFPEYEEMIKLDIWDTAGQERYRSIAKIYYQSADCIMFVYDITKNESFSDLKNYYTLVKESVNFEKVAVAVVGNKIDLYDKEDVNSEEVKTYCEEIHAISRKVSALNSSGIDELFETIGKELLKGLKGENQEAEEKPKKLENSRFLSGVKKIDGKRKDSVVACPC